MNQIKTIQLATGTWVFVEVPVNAKQLKVATDNEGFTRLWFGLPIIRGFSQVELPEGHAYTLIGKADSLTEDQWKQIVGVWSSGIYNYENPPVKVETAKESGLSLLKSQGMEPDTCVILKQND